MEEKIFLSSLFHKNEVKVFRKFIYDLAKNSQTHLIQSEILLSFEVFCQNCDDCEEVSKGSKLHRFFEKTQEILLGVDTPLCSTDRKWAILDSMVSIMATIL